MDNSINELEKMLGALKALSTNSKRDQMRIALYEDMLTVAKVADKVGPRQDYLHDLNNEDIAKLAACGSSAQLLLALILNGAIKLDE